MIFWGILIWAFYLRGKYVKHELIITLAIHIIEFLFQGGGNYLFCVEKKSVIFSQKMQEKS